jgi:polar amino acid transport system permease protein
VTSPREVTGGGHPPPVAAGGGGAGAGGADPPSRGVPRRRLSRRQRARLWRAVQYGVLVAVVAVAALVADWDRIIKAFFDLEVMASQFPAIIVVALRNTVIYAGLGFTFGLVLGMVLALMRLSPVGPYRWIATAYIEFFRGIPGLLVFVALGFGVPVAFDVRFDIYTTVMLALGLMGAAFMAETIRAGVQAVPRGQIEAARSLGMTPGATMIAVVLPQALRIILPPLTNELILLTKDSSLVYLLGLAADQYELAKYGRSALTEYRSLSPIVVAGLCYLAVTLPLSRVSRLLETRYSGARTDRRRTGTTRG